MRVPGGKERKESEKSMAFAAMVMVKLLEGVVGKLVMAVA